MSDEYDAGLLNDYGGGNVEWWHDYLRAEIGRCNEFHKATIASLKEALKECNQVVKNFYEENEILKGKDLVALRNGFSPRYFEEENKALRARVDELEDLTGKRGVGSTIARLTRELAAERGKVEMIKGAVHAAKLLGTPFCPLIGTIEQILTGEGK